MEKVPPKQKKISGATKEELLSLDKEVSFLQITKNTDITSTSCSF